MIQELHNKLVIRNKAKYITAECMLMLQVVIIIEKATKYAPLSAVRHQHGSELLW